MVQKKWSNNQLGLVEIKNIFTSTQQTKMVFMSWVLRDNYPIMWNFINFLLISLNWSHSIVLVDLNEFLSVLKKGNILTPDTRTQPQTSLESIYIKGK